MKKILSIFILLAFLFVGEALHAQAASPESEQDTKPVIDLVMSPKGEDVVTFVESRNESNSTVVVGEEATNNIGQNQLEDTAYTDNEEIDESGTKTVQEKRELLNSIVTYPNPANFQLTVQFKSEGDYTLYIYNLLGQLEEEYWVEAQKEEKLDVSDWQEGVYLLQIVQDQEQVTRRIKISR